MSKTRETRWAKPALLAAAIIWGGSFVGMKSLTEVLPTQYLLAVRFSLAALVMAITLLPRLKKLTWSYAVRGGIIGVCLYAAYSFQTYGLRETTPGKNAFLTAAYCVLVPFLYWAVDKQRPDRYNLSAAVLAVVGIGLVSLNGDLSVGRGDMLTLVGGILYAVHMVAVVKGGRDHDPFLITLVQFTGTAACAWIGAWCFEEVPPLSAFTAEAVGALAYLVLCATCLTLSFQTFGQQHTSPSSAAILLSLESVFGVLFSVLAGERPTAQVVIGFAVIFAAVIVSETKLSFLRSRKMRRKSA